MLFLKGFLKINFVIYLGSLLAALMTEFVVVKQVRVKLDHYLFRCEHPSRLSQNALSTKRRNDNDWMI